MNRQLIRLITCIGIFIFLPLSSIAQKKDFEKEWLVIEQLEIDGKVKSALEKVNTLNTKAIRKKNNTQQLKTLLFRWKFLQIIDEKSSIKILEEINAEITQQNFPNKQLLHMYKASFLETYLNTNYWNISKRTPIEKSELQNFKTWDQTTFLNQISSHYETALKPFLNLATIPTQHISELLVTVPINRKYKPTVFDIIAHKALHFYKNTRNRVNQPKDLFLIDKETFFDTSSSFIKQQITTNDTESLLYKALTTYQQLEQVHSQQKNSTVLLSNSLQRLQFVKNNFTGLATKKKYLKALQHLTAEFKSNKAVAQIELALAKTYRNNASQKNEEGKYLYPDYNQKALALIKSIEDKKTEVAILIEAKNLKNKILQPQLTWKTLDQYLPNKPHLAQITYANCNQINIVAYKVPYKYNFDNFRYNKRDSLIRTYLSKKTPVFNKTYTLPQKKDYNSYSTEVIVPQLPLGSYLFQIQTDTLVQSLKYHKLQVTELSVNKTEDAAFSKYQVLNNYSGIPVNEATVLVETETDRGKNNTQTTHYTTNQWGEFSLPRKKRYQNNTLIISTPLDTLRLKDYNYRYYKNRNNTPEKETVQTKTLLFLDRAIYRPGQKVYYKAVAISKIDGKTAVIPNQKITLEFEDANDDSIFETSLTTNAYGSVSGSFKLPKSGITGEFTGYAYLDEKYVEKINSGDNEAEKYFSVEEYKRPTFEVTFLPTTKIYKPLDSIQVQGNAKAFLGSWVTDATVTYSVKRSTQHRYWWRYSGNHASKQITQGTLKTDSKGAFFIDFKAETDEKEYANKIYSYTVEVKVTDLNGETRENTTVINVADKNLLATINTLEKWESKKTPSLAVTSEDINGNPITTSGSLKIYRLQTPGRFLNTRPWLAPDIQQISETDFTTTFPHIPYTNENLKKNWKKGPLVFEIQFTNQSEHLIKLPHLTHWKSGSYRIETQITDPITQTSTKTQKNITFKQARQDFPADEQLLVYQTHYNKNNPRHIELELQTAVPKLTVFAEVFDGNRSIWKEKIPLTKGFKKVNIKLPKLNTPKVTVNYKYQIFNEFYTVTETLDFTPKPVVLAIEKKHFTNKLYPAQKETWSFNMTTSNNQAFNAEALASMYDASLDTFKKDPWHTNFGFHSYYPSPNTPKLLTRGYPESVTYYKPITNLHAPSIPYEQVNFFGFEFNQVNSWKYKRYLQKRKIAVQLKTPNGNARKITGVVRNAGLPLPGVNIIVHSTENNSNSTVTDFDGQYSITVKKGDVLEFSSIGFKIQSILVEKNNIIDIDLIEEIQTLDDAVLIGHGKPKRSRKELTGAVTPIKAEQIESFKPVSLEQALVANAAGVSIKKSIKTSTSTSYDLKHLKNIPIRKNLKETAFFLPHLKTNPKGGIEFEFTAPEALTRWNFRMLAHTKKAIAGTLNAQTLTQKDLSILPNAPRFVREGDQLRFSAKVVNLTAKKMEGTALLTWSNSVTGEIINHSLKHLEQPQKFSIPAKGNSLLHWKISIPKEGLSAIQYKIVAQANNFTDGEEKIIPVLSNRKLVTESVPLWVRPKTTEQFSLANFNPKSTTQKPHQITLEYTSNPAWMAIKSLPYLMEFPHECSEQTFSRLYANTMAAHILNSQPQIKAVFKSWQAKGTLQSPLEKNEDLKSILIAESPWLQEAKSETEQQKRLATLFDLEKTAQAQQKALNKLRQLQLSNGGFPWFNGGRANTFITRHIVVGFGHLETLGVTKSQTKTNTILENALRFLDANLVHDYDQYLQHHETPENFYKQVRWLHWAYARSFHLKTFPLKGKAKEIITKVRDFHKTDWQSRSLYEKGLLALILHRFEKSPVSQQILTALIETAVNSKENGMYWKENTHSWWWYRSAISTQALLIEAFSEMKQPPKYLEEMKIFLLQNKRTNRWDTTISTADASYALLLEGNAWLSVKDRTFIRVGDTKIRTQKLLETEKEQGTGYLKTAWKAPEITSQFKTLTITNKSEVTGYGGYYWQYFEDLDQIKTDDKNPLSISKQLYKKVTTNKGTQLKRLTSKTSLTIGDKVTVRLLIKSDHTLEFVHLKDQRASGFEPIKVLSGYEYQDGLAYYQSTKDAASHFFIDRLPKGNYVLEYDVIANQAGNFSNGITNLQCMYAPEFGSHSAGERIQILE